MTKAYELSLQYKSTETIPIGDGGHLYYETEGIGTEPPLVFVNNFYMVGAVWRNFTGNLKNRRRLVYYDLRNQGASEPPQNSQTTFDHHVDDLETLLDHVGAPSAVLVGSSVSCLIVKEFARRHPSRTAGLVFVGPGFSPNGTIRRKLISKSWLTALERGGIEGLFDQLYPLVFCDQSIHENGVPGYIALKANFMSLLSRRSIRDNLEGVLEVSDDVAFLRDMAVPVHFVLGDGDFAWSDSVLADAVAQIGHATSATIPRSGHIPYFDRPDEFARILENFVDERL